MSKTMKACVYYGPHDLRIEDVPYPTIQKPDDAIVKVLKQGICGTDIHIAHGDMPEVASGRILGHEFIGEIAELGPAYIGKFKVGDKVAVSPITQCGGCFQCRNGEYSHCEMDGGWIFGYMINGSQAEYIRVPHANMAFYEIPEGVNDASAIFAMDALSTGFFGVENAFIKPGDVVAVMGCGPVAMGCLAAAKLYGPSCVVCVGTNEHRLDVALREGVADVALNPNKVDVVETIKEITKGRGADCTIEAVGVKGTYNLALNAVRIGGNVSIVGVFAD